MVDDLAKYIRCRNYAEELRIIAADKEIKECREALLRVAADYDRIADSYEAIANTKARL